MRAKIIGLLLAAALQASSGIAAPTPQSQPIDAQCTALLAKRMPIDRFWSLVEKTTDKDDLEQQRALEAVLTPLSVDELIGFEITFQAEHIRSYTWDLWGVAEIANGGASDDGFEYFRYWLMSRGRKIFEQVLADPDSLAEIVPADQIDVLENEPFAAAAFEVWRRKTGKSYEAVDEFVRVRCLPFGKEPLGTRAKSLKERFPKTWKRFGDKPLG